MLKSMAENDKFCATVVLKASAVKGVGIFEDSLSILIASQKNRAQQDGKTLSHISITCLGVMNSEISPSPLKD